MVDAAADPFEAIVIAVPARGVERWLSQQLSHTLGAVDADGVCANVRFPSPAELLDDAAAQTSPELAGALAAWADTRWPIMVLLDDLGADPAYDGVRSYLDGGTSRRYALAAKVARLFASYAEDRPEVLVGWAQGEGDVPADLAWQPLLWRRLREALGTSPAELHQQVCQSLRQRPDTVTLPQSWCVYGPSRLSKARLQVLAALAEHRKVHLFVHHPGSALWSRVPAGVERRREDASHAGVQHPLLAPLSRDVRELQQRVLLAVPDLMLHVHDDVPKEKTLLQRLQRDLRTDTLPTDTVPADCSVQLHACHGPARQVEVLRELVLGLLESDPTLEPRDVLVLCPDVETYAPLLTAAFATNGHPGGRLWVQIADRSPRQTNTLFGLAARLLHLAGSRVTGAEVLDLAGSPTVRERFALSDDDLEQLRSWVVGTRIHWGLNAAHRNRWGLTVDDGTWRRGLDRLATGAVLASDDPWAQTLPYDALESGDIELVGRFAELLDRVEAALDSFTACVTASDWLTALEAAVEALGAVGRDGEWQRQQLHQTLTELQDAAGDTPMALHDLTALLAEVLAGRPTRTSFRTGALTVCTLTPMRSVPHKVVILLGMDDGAFPRHSLPDGDDYLGRDPRLGERDPRSEDRQLFLDAILAAEKHLVVLYTGAHVRTGAELPPAVPVGELLDALKLNCSNPADLVTKHPLQPFDPLNFQADRPFSFDPSAFAGAVAARGPLTETPVFLDAPVTARPGTTELRQLTDLLLHPAKAFLRQRLELTTTGRDAQPNSELPLDLNGLQTWAIGNRMLRARLAGRTPADIKTAERARGDLPPGAVGNLLLQGLGPQVDALADEAAPYLVGPAETLDIDLRLGDEHLLGAVTGLQGEELVQVSYSKAGPKLRMRLWLDLLAVTAAHGGQRRGVLIARSRTGTTVEMLMAVSQEESRRLLTDLLALRAVGLQTPLALPLQAAEAYADARRTGDGSDMAKDAAAKCWVSPFGFDGDDRDPDNALVWGYEAPFQTLWSWRSPVPLPTGAVAGGEVCDFARLAVGTWEPLLTAMRP